MSQSVSVERLLEELERSLLEPSVRKSGVVGRSLAEDFVEVGSSGRVLSKAQVVAALQAESQVPVSVSQFSVRVLAPNVALVTYRAHRQSEPPVQCFRSSIWECRQGQWQLAFHQGTLTPAAEAT
jgi:hypothetical protein